MKAIFLALIFIGLMASVVVWQGGVKSAAPALITESDSIKRWMRLHVADQEARLSAVSEVQDFDGKAFLRARVAARNKLGGPVCQDFLFEVLKSGAVESYTEEEFTAWADTGIARLVGEKRTDDWIALRDHSRSFKDITLQECR